MSSMKKSNESNHSIYMRSKQWEREKRKAVEQKPSPMCSITGCDRYKRDWHHYKGYEAIWTENDYMFITQVCGTHHFLCHFTLFGKVSLTKKDLVKRYNYLCRHKWRRLRPSHILELWIVNELLSLGVLLLSLYYLLIGFI